MSSSAPTNTDMSPEIVATLTGLSPISADSLPLLEQELITVSPALIDEKLTLEAFQQLSGNLGGYPFVKVVVDRETGSVHFLNNRKYRFHAEYIAEKLLKISFGEMTAKIDEFNESFYQKRDRRFFLGILALHRRQNQRFFSLETVEVDTMDGEMLRSFFVALRKHVEAAAPLFWKPANHGQETMAAAIDPADVPRIFAHELFASASFVALNAGSIQGRLRVFRTEKDYRLAWKTIEWHDILVMHRVPDDLPRVSGIINAHHTTPLSHTNVLASGWGIPNAVQIGIIDRIEKEGLSNQWVTYTVDMNSGQVALKKLDGPFEVGTRPAWSVQRIKLEEPETVNTAIVDLDELRMSDRYKYGTKAANLGELRNLLAHGSERLLGFYRVRRPPRENLLPYLAKMLGVAENSDIARAAWQFVRDSVNVPRGIAIPFSCQQEFLESSPRIQQGIGKLKMALELGARETDALCLSLQQMIRATRMPDRLRSKIDSHIAMSLAGVSSFVVRSSSNAEDLENFSAAGIYESINHVTTADKVFESIKEVWASLLSPRSVRLRNDVGISLDDSYMGVVVQEEVPSIVMGGVMVTTNPMKRGTDFRNIYINVSTKSAVEVVQGSELPYQYLFNTVEGGGMTVSLGEGLSDLPESYKQQLQKLAFVGRLLQSHFSPDYTFSAPVDIEWVASKGATPDSPPILSVLQLRPYAH